MSNTPNRTAGTWLSAIIVAVIGILLFMYLVMSGVMPTEAPYFTTHAPGDTTFEVGESGTFMIYHEFQRTQDSQGMLRPPGIEDLKIQVVEVATGEPVELESDTDSQYAIRRTVGESIYRFEAPAAGSYRIITIYPAGGTASYGLTIGRPYGQKFYTAFLRAAIVLVVTGVLVVTIIVVGARRNASGN